MSKSKKKPSQGPKVPLPDYLAQRDNHGALLATGQTLLNGADLIWPQIQQAFDELAAHAFKARREAETPVTPPGYRSRSLSTSASGGGELQPIPIVRLVQLQGFANTYLLIAGYAVENLLKAVRIKRLTIERKPIDFGRTDDQILTTHAYVGMAKKELGDLSQSEVEILKRLSVFVSWAGRYPVAREAPPLDEIHGMVRTSDDRTVISALCARIVDKYKSLTQAGGG